MTATVIQVNGVAVLRLLSVIQVVELLVITGDGKAVADVSFLASSIFSRNDMLFLLVFMLILHDILQN